MPRWPGGLHLGAGSVRAGLSVPVRPKVVGQESYWRRESVPLYTAVPVVTVNGAGLAASFVGPAAVGEWWRVELVQVQTTSGLAHKTQAQVWRGVGGFTQNLLMISNNGGYDDLGCPGRPIQAGEQIIVVWENAHPGDLAWATVEGHKTVGQAYGGRA